MRKTYLFIGLLAFISSCGNYSRQEMELLRQEQHLVQTIVKILNRDNEELFRDLQRYLDDPAMFKIKEASNGGVEKVSYKSKNFVDSLDNLKETLWQKISNGDTSNTEKYLDYNINLTQQEYAQINTRLTALRQFFQQEYQQFFDSVKTYLNPKCDYLSDFNQNLRLQQLGFERNAPFIDFVLAALRLEGEVEAAKKEWLLQIDSITQVYPKYKPLQIFPGASFKKLIVDLGNSVEMEMSIGTITNTVQSENVVYKINGKKYLPNNPDAHLHFEQITRKLGKKNLIISASVTNPLTGEVTHSESWFEYEVVDCQNNK